ncbi:hypothetical protein N9T17_02285 [Candidatus Pelagibacter sp.]|nr:hypothetical protein [Candidatus Pelagibacter sp.]
MKKNLIKYIFIIISILSFLIVYLSIFGLETEKFNSQIKNKINQTDKNFEVELKKIRLTLNPLNFKINAKTIAPKVFYKKRIIELEYIETQISIFSLIKNQIISSKLKFSTKSIFLKDLITFAKVITNKPELFVLERAVKNGQIIVDVDLDFDETGKIKNDYKIKAILKDGKIGLLKKYNFEKINFSLNVHNNIFNFKDLSFTNSKSSFFSENIKIIKSKKDFFVEGQINNKETNLSKELLKLLNINISNIEFSNTNFNSDNKFSFLIDKNFKVKNLALDSNIQINESDYKIPIILNKFFNIKNNTVKINEHNITSNYKNNNLVINGSGKIKVNKNFDDLEYSINLKDNDIILKSKLILSELKLNSNEYLKNFIPKLNENTILKDQKIEINFDKKKLQVEGQGKVKFENYFEDIKFNFSKIENKFDFSSQIDLKETSFKIDFLNFKKNDKLKTQIKISGNYDTQDSLHLKNLSILNKDNKLIIKNVFLDRENLIEKIDEANLEFFDEQDKKNKVSLKKINDNEYQINGSVFNANKLIDNLLENKKNKDSKLFKNDFKLNLNIREVYLDSKNIINNLIGKLNVRNNKIYASEISGDFDNQNNLKFTINTNNTGEKITTLFSSRAKPIVSRYKFIKGYEEGYLDFYSSKKDKVSKSQLKIYNFKLQELPILTKLLTLASLQGIADTLSGEGIRFNEFEMNFTNKDNLMTIEEIYAIGPAISILMSGYVEEKKLVSLRGTLVPATTINKSIGSIPLLGKILVGDKTGEGVFGVSFKIKGPPKKLETTVNPIKTLTPRFITRTLEKIKIN